MLTHVHIKNFRSFVDAQTPLRPFTLVLGANGSGKSNFLKFFQATSEECKDRTVNGQVVRGFRVEAWTKHLSQRMQPAEVRFSFADDSKVSLNPHTDGNKHEWLVFTSKLPWEGKKLAIYNPLPEMIGAPEKPVSAPVVKGDGSGTCQVLDALKTGDREDLFDQIEKAFRTYVPEVEKLSLKTLGDTKQIQVRERGLKEPLPAPELSEGTRLILCMLTILHQEKPPPIILLEDIDRGLHPRLFEYVAPLIRRMAEDHKINIIATTHNPYLVDYFRDDKEAVVLVEKVDGESKLIPLPERLKETTYSDTDAEDMPLGQLWFSGLIGGTPRTIQPRK